MTEPSPLPPRLRDTRSLVDRVRQDRNNLKQLGVGFVGGRFSPAKPLGSTAQFGDLETDDPGSTIGFIDTDNATAAGPGSVTVRLTFTPIDGSLHVYWNGLAQPPTEWTLRGNVVTIPDLASLVVAGDVFSAAYAYDLLEEPAGIIPTIQFIGVTELTDSITSIALPAGTLPGDLLILASGAWGSASTSDPRMTDSVGSLSSLGVAWGFATSDTSPVSVAVDGSAFNWAATVLAVYRGVAVIDHASLGMTGPDSILPVLSDADAAIGIVLAFNGGFVSGTLGLDTSGAWESNGIANSANTHVRISSWHSDPTEPTPPGAFHLTGGFGGGTTVTLKLGDIS